MGDIEQLLADLKKAEHGNNELDARLDVLIVPLRRFEAGKRLNAAGTKVITDYESGTHGTGRAGDYTTRTEWALNLLRDALPGMLVENLGEMRDSGHLTGHWLAQLGPRGPRRRLEGPITAENVAAVLDGLPPVSGHTPALALCIAIVAAKIAEAQK